MGTETVAGVGTAHRNWDGGLELRGGVRNLGLRQQAMGFWGIVDGATRSPQRRFALLRVDIEIVWVLRCFFFFFYFLLSIFTQR